jgi:hypothetical protein
VPIAICVSDILTKRSTARVPVIGPSDYLRVSFFLQCATAVTRVRKASAAPTVGWPRMRRRGRILRLRKDAHQRQRDVRRVQRPSHEFADAGACQRGGIVRGIRAGCED